MDEKDKEGQELQEDASNSENEEAGEKAGANDSESESSDSDVVSEKEEENSDAGIDHEAELEKERERLGKKIDKERQKRIDAEKQKGISREEAEAIVNSKLAEQEKRLVRRQAELVAERLASSPAEKERILLHYDNSIVPTGNVEEDVENAYAIVNKKRFQGQISELKKANQSKKTVQTGDSGPGTPIQQKKPQKFSQEVIDAAQFAGVSPEEFVKKQKT